MLFGRGGASRRGLVLFRASSDELVFGRTTGLLLETVRVLEGGRERKVVSRSGVRVLLGDRKRMVMHRDGSTEGCGREGCESRRERGRRRRESEGSGCRHRKMGGGWPSRERKSRSSEEAPGRREGCGRDYAAGHR